MAVVAEDVYLAMTRSGIYLRGRRAECTWRQAGDSYSRGERVEMLPSTEDPNPLVKFSPPLAAFLLRGPAHLDGERLCAMSSPSRQRKQTEDPAITLVLFESM